MQPQAGGDHDRIDRDASDGDYRYYRYRNRDWRSRNEYRHHSDDRNDFDLGDNKLDEHVLIARV